MSDSEPPPSGPVVFISYSWTTPAHEDWVREVASELRSAWKLDVRLDKWHLRTGEDALHFMERMIREADKVLIVSDCEYARKANSREGGAGVEAQILTPELYAQGGGDEAGGKLPKYAVAVTEYGEDRKACTPAFYGGRIFIDLTDPTQRAEKMEEIARWAHDQPLHVAPPIGGRPDFLTAGPTTGTSGARSRALAALEASRPDAARAVEDYFDRLVVGIAAFAPEAAPDANGRLTREQVWEAHKTSIAALADAWREAEGILLELARARLGERGHQVIRRLFSGLFVYTEPATLPDGRRIDQWQRDAYSVVVPDLVRSAVAALIRADDFDGVCALVAVPYAPPDPDRGRTCAVREFAALQRGVYDDHLRSRVPYLLDQAASAYTDDELGQADLLLYFASVHADSERYMPTWWPDRLTGERVRHYGAVLPTFAQAESRSHLDRVAAATNRDAPALLALIDDLNTRDAQTRRSSSTPQIDFGRVTGRDRLGTRP